MKREIVITHLWVKSFGWETTIYCEEDFVKVETVHSDPNCSIFIGYFEKAKVILKGYYE
jgi:hypothetical protein